MLLRYPLLAAEEGKICIPDDYNCIVLSLYSFKSALVILSVNVNYSNYLDFRSAT